MWRAEVVERHSEDRVTVIIPSLYRFSPVGPIQSSVDAVEGSRVVVADLTPGAKVHDWWVVGFESQAGQWAEAAPHTHPLGQVDGLVEALAAKADLTALATKVNSSTYTAGMNTKAEAPGAWTDCAVASFLEPSQPAYPVLAARSSPVGMQLRGRYRVATATARDVVAFTLPAGFTPSFPILFNVAAMGPGLGSGTDYPVLTYQFEIHTDRTVTTRQPLDAGARMNFNHTIIL